MSERKSLTENELHRLMLETAAPLTDVVNHKIPGPIKTQVSAEDVLQEAWTLAFRKAPHTRWQSAEDFKKWLAYVVHCQTVDAIRHALRQKRGGQHKRRMKTRAQEPFLIPLLTSIISPNKSPSSITAVQEASEAIRVALNGLSPERREAIWLRFGEGRSLNEIAECMEKSDSAVRSLLYQGLLHLRRILGWEGNYFNEPRLTDSQTLSQDAS